VVEVKGCFEVRAGESHPAVTGRLPPNSLLKNRIAGRPVQNDEMQGGRVLRNEAYNQYAAMTKDEAQRRRSSFSTA